MSGCHVMDVILDFSLNILHFPGGAASQREALPHVSEMLGGIDLHGMCCRRADLYVPLSNRFYLEAKLGEHLEVEQTACTTLK